MEAAALDRKPESLCKSGFVAAGGREDGREEAADYGTGKGGL